MAARALKPLPRRFQNDSKKRYLDASEKLEKSFLKRFPDAVGKEFEAA